MPAGEPASGTGTMITWEIGRESDGSSRPARGFRHWEEPS
jgi:hypothetical protein